MEWYKDHFLAYIKAAPEVREESRKHWIRCHKENISSGREDLIIFSAKMLGSICLAEEFLKELDMSK